MAKKKPSRQPAARPTKASRQPAASRAPAPPPAAPAANPPAVDPHKLPKKLWVQWSKRQYKILDEQAQRYGIPVGGPTIDLALLAQWIHDLLAAHGRRILAGDASEDIDAGTTNSPALERKREVEYQIRLRELAQLDGQLVSRDAVRSGLAAIVSVLRHYGDQVQRQFGADALDLFNDTLADAERAIEQQFDQPASGAADENEKTGDAD